MTKDNRARFTFRMPEPMFNALKAKSEELGVSMNALILQILWDWVKERGEEEGGRK